MNGIQRSLGVWRGTAVMLNIVLGAGLLILPGLAIREGGEAALSSWLIAAVAALPLLAVFVVLGKRHADAGGVAELARRAFGPLGHLVTSMLFLGAVCLGLPAIALTAGHYAVSVAGGSVHAWAAVLVLMVFTLNAWSVKLAGTISQGLSWSIGIFVAGLAAVCGWLVWDLPAPRLAWPWQGTDGMTTPVALFPMVFFAFTGWEVAASLAEDFRQPHRDFPRAMVASFVIAVSFYLLMAYIAQQADLDAGLEAPFATIVGAHLGPIGARMVGTMACVLLFANLLGATWAVSRMVFSLARERVLPAALGNLHRDQPRAALTAFTSVVILVIAVDRAGVLDARTAFSLAGQNFFLIYGIVAASLLKMATSTSERCLAVIAIAVVVSLSAAQAGSLAYPAAIVLTALAVQWIRSRRLTPG